MQIQTINQKIQNLLDDVAYIQEVTHNELDKGEIILKLTLYEMTVTEIIMEWNLGVEQTIDNMDIINLGYRS